MSDSPYCTECGFEADDLDQLDAHECSNSGNLSVDADTLETLFDKEIEAASHPAIPDLGALFADAQDKGIIKPQVVGSGQPT